MNSEVRTYRFPNGEIQRVQTVRPGSWTGLRFGRPQFTEPVFREIVNLYRRWIVPAFPWIFGRMLLFYIPDGFSPKAGFRSKKYGTVSDPLTAAAVLLRSGTQIRGGKPVFSDSRAASLYRELKERNAVDIVCGKLPATRIIPVGRDLGFLSETERDATLKCNTSFFIMDSFDCATPYDAVGTPIGLFVSGGNILNPPLYRREALLVRRDGSVSVGIPDIRDLVVEIGGRRYEHGRNAVFRTRPDTAVSPPSRGTDYVITGCRVAAVCPGGRARVPASGFVLSTTEEIAESGTPVRYLGMEEVVFGIQGGNSTVTDGVPAEAFTSSFFNIRNPLRPVSYPPSLYPLGFQKDRSARMALGCGADGMPVLVWAEGAGKLRYEPGTDSRGATLLEMGVYCRDAGMVSGINLDGGGSAQILIQGERAQMISDRTGTNEEMERPIPAGLFFD